MFSLVCMYVCLLSLLLARCAAGDENKVFTYILHKPYLILVILFSRVIWPISLQEQKQKLTLAFQTDHLVIHVTFTKPNSIETNIAIPLSSHVLSRVEI